jgi:hypothetical protein
MAQIRIRPRNTQPTPNQEGLVEKITRVSFFGTIWIFFAFFAKISSFIEDVTKNIAEKAKRKAGFT